MPIHSKKITEELIEEIALAIETPCHTRAALASVGCGHTQFYEWMKIGMRAPLSIYGQLRKRILVAESTREKQLTKLVHDGALKDARWAAWLLERLYPERWGPNALPAPDDEADAYMLNDANLALDALPDDELEILERAAEILERLGAAHGVPAISVEAREKQADPVLPLHVPGGPRVPPQLAPPIGSDEA